MSHLQNKLLHEPTPDEVDALNQRGFILKAVLGSGSFAVVYGAAHRQLDRRMRLACKVVDIAKAPREHRDKFFPRELDILMKVSHPNIIGLHSILQRGSRFFIFMRYAENGDLLDWISNNGAIPEIEARKWFSQIVSAVGYLHLQNLAHRDLKCENILLSKNMNIKVADFGFSRHCWNHKLNRPILSYTFCGSAAYAAPEIISGTPYDPKKADIWSLGVVLYVMLNAKMPFDQDSNHTILLNQQVLKKWSFKRGSDCSTTVRSLVRKILEADITQRLSLEDIVSHRWLTEHDIGAAGDNELCNLVKNTPRRRSSRR